MKKLLILALIVGLGNARTVYATAYTSTRGQTDSTPCISASNQNICKLHSKGVRIIAVSRDLRRYYPYGSHVVFEGKRYLVADTMHPRWHNRIDVYLGENYKSVRRWKNRKVDIKGVK